MPNVREPQKVNSIDKKNRILNSGLKLFSKNGFYNTTTVDIAKDAGVSTGIVYSYFNDKKDILLKSIHLYFQNIFKPLEKQLEKIEPKKDRKELIKNFISLTIKSHKDNHMPHEEMLAMSHLDKDVHKAFMLEEQTITEKIKNYLIAINVSKINIDEKVHIAYNVIEDFCHEVVYHKHDFINYDILLEEAIELIYNLFK